MYLYLKIYLQSLILVINQLDAQNLVIQ